MISTLDSFITEELKRDRQILAYLLSGGRVLFEGAIFGFDFEGSEIVEFNKRGEVK